MISAAVSRFRRYIGCITRIAYYEADIQSFLTTDDEAILGTLTMQHGFALKHQQKHAWHAQIKLLKQHLPPTLSGWIYFEFSIPRMGKRVDVVVVTGGVVLVIEFKVGAHNFDRYAVEQVYDYALDLKNFHRGSHNCPILPVLIATAAPPQPMIEILWAPDRVAEPVCISATDFSFCELSAYELWLQQHHPKNALLIGIPSKSS